MYRLYSLVLALLALGYLPLFLVRKVWGAGYPVALRERFGFIRVPPPPTPAGRFWVHAVSVGEVMAAVPLVQALRVRWPAADIVVSTVTATGERVARARLPEAVATLTFPLDFRRSRPAGRPPGGAPAASSRSRRSCGPISCGRFARRRSPRCSRTGGSPTGPTAATSWSAPSSGGCWRT